MLTIRYVNEAAIGGYPVVYSVKPAGIWTRLVLWFNDRFKPKQPKLAPIKLDTVFRSIGIPISLKDYCYIVNSQYADDITSTISLVPPATYTEMEEVPRYI